MKDCGISVVIQGISIVILPCMLNEGEKPKIGIISVVLCVVVVELYQEGGMFPFWSRLGLKNPFISRFLLKSKGFG